VFRIKVEIDPFFSSRSVPLDLKSHVRVFDPLLGDQVFLEWRIRVVSFVPQCRTFSRWVFFFHQEVKETISFRLERSQTRFRVLKGGTSG